MKYSKICLIFLSAVVACIFLSSCGQTLKCPPHDYKIVSSNDATCTVQGSITYKCTKCGDEYTNATDIDSTRHNPGPDATTENPQVCLDCGVTLAEKLPLTPVTAVRSLAINHYAGVASPFCTTRIDTQVHSKFTLPTQRYYDSDPTTQVAKPLDLDVSIPIQEFYTHDILSVYRLGTEDGKTFTTPNGFKVKFNLETIESMGVSDLYAASDGDFFDNYDNVDALKIVRIYQSSAAYGGIFEVVDFSNSYIEIEKDGDSVNSKKITLWDETNKTIRTEVEMTDANSRLFYEEGTYRILFKYSIAWLTNPTSAVYDENGNACYPYGLINDQYDYFYVTITNEKDGILVPEDVGTNDELFYQLRVDAVTAGVGELFLPSKGTIRFGETAKLYVDNILDFENGTYSFNGSRLNKFTLSFYRYDYDSDTGLEGANPYLFYDEKDLMRLLNGEESFEVALKKDPQLRNRPCMMVVTSEFFDKNTSRTVTVQQTYIFTFDWEA